MEKWTPKVILEGTRLTNKTETAYCLNEHPKLVGPRKYRYHSPIVSGEWCGFTNHPWGRGLINYLPEEEPLAIETYDAWLRLFELLRYYSWIVDRFHISTQAHQLATHGRVFNLEPIEERLKALNFSLVFLHRSPESFESARAERLKVSGNPAQYDDLSAFVEEQERMRALVERSTLRTLCLDVSNRSPQEASDSITRWVIESDALTMKETRHPLLGS